MVADPSLQVRQLEALPCRPPQLQLHSSLRHNRNLDDIDANACEYDEDDAHAFLGDRGEEMEGHSH